MTNYQNNTYGFVNYLNDTIRINYTIINRTIILIKVDTSTYQLDLRDIDLPFSGTQQLTIETAINNTVYISCNGFLTCPSSIVAVTSPFTIDVGYSIPTNFVGTYHNYIIFTVYPNKVAKKDFIFTVTQTHGFSYNFNESDIDECLKLFPVQLGGLDSFMIDCMNHLKNKTEFVNRTVYVNDTHVIVRDVTEFNIQSLERIVNLTQAIDEVNSMRTTNVNVLIDNQTVAGIIDTTLLKQELETNRTAMLLAAQKKKWGWSNYILLFLGFYILIEIAYRLFFSGYRFFCVVVFKTIKQRWF
jgi:hypothetical protein